MIAYMEIIEDRVLLFVHPQYIRHFDRTVLVKLKNFSPPRILENKVIAEHLTTIKRYL